MLFAITKSAVAVLVFVSSSVSFADIVMFGSGPNQFSMEFVPIGNPGNPPDGTRGTVGYDYRMGKFEVSEDMITKYNANFGMSNGLAITTSELGPNKPATGVSWNEAARFVNWLNTSNGGFPAYKFASSGVDDNIVLWTPADTLDYDVTNPFRSLRSDYVLPSNNEWYKSAYYDPASTTYFDFPTGSNTAPTAVSSGTAANTAVYNGRSFPANFNNAGGLSPYGIMGLGGNAREWLETEGDLVNDDPASSRSFRGGNWLDTVDSLMSTRRFSTTPTSINGTIGFRVVSLSSAIPEPSSMLSVCIGTCVLSLARRQRSRNL